MSTIKLKSLIETAATKTSFGSNSGQKSVRRFTISQDQVDRLTRGPFREGFSNTAGPEEACYRLADARYIKFPETDSEEVPYELIVPRQMERSSKDSWNTYTVLLSKLPSWKGWPRRSLSVIFYVGHPGGIGAEGGYGNNIYRIIPKNGAKIAVSNNPDILNARVFSHMQSLLAGPTKEVADITSLCHMLGRVVTWGTLIKNPPKTWGIETTESREANDWLKNIRTEDYEQAIELLDDSLNKKTLPAIRKGLNDSFKSAPRNAWATRSYLDLGDTFEEYVNLLEKYGGWEKLLSEALDPVKNGFQLMAPGNVRPPDRGAVEAWTEDTCMLINKGGYESD
jgi:hypothetical protein